MASEKKQIERLLKAENARWVRLQKSAPEGARWVEDIMKKNEVATTEKKEESSKIPVSVELKVPAKT
jgi:hypothetical protein